MEEVRVACGVLVRNGLVLAAKRRADQRCPEGGWEFAGGKIEAGETPQQALARELAEELGVHITTSWYLDTVEHEDYGWHLVLECYVCPLDEQSEPTCREHEELRWIGRDALVSLDWIAADRILAQRIGMFWDQLFGAEHL